MFNSTFITADERAKVASFVVGRGDWSVQLTGVLSCFRPIVFPSGPAGVWRCNGGLWGRCIRQPLGVYIAILCQHSNGCRLRRAAGLTGEVPHCGSRQGVGR